MTFKLIICTLWITICTLRLIKDIQTLWHQNLTCWSWCRTRDVRHGIPGSPFPKAPTMVLSCMTSTPRGETALSVLVCFLGVCRGDLVPAPVLPLGVTATKLGRFGTTVSRVHRVSAEAPFPRHTGMHVMHRDVYMPAHFTCGIRLT